MNENYRDKVGKMQSFLTRPSCQINKKYGSESDQSPVRSNSVLMKDTGKRNRLGCHRKSLA